MRDQNAHSRIRIATEDFPENERLEAWDHLYGSVFHPIETTTPAARPLCANITFHVLPGISTGFGTISAHQSWASRRHLENTPDVISIVGSRGNGGMRLSDRRADLFPNAGDALIYRGNVEHKCGSASLAEYVAVAVSWRTFEQLAPGFRLKEARLLNRTAYVGYLMDYVQVLEPKANLPGDLAAVIATHLRDLVALAVGSTRDIEHEAKGRGLMAARLKLAKDFIRQHLLDPRLSDEMTARGLGVSPMYIRKLFTVDGSGGISRYITEQRLGLAHRELTRSELPTATIMEVMLRCGFSGISTFNRLFKARFGMTPSEARDEAREELMRAAELKRGKASR